MRRRNIQHIGLRLLQLIQINAGCTARNGNSIIPVVCKNAPAFAKSGVFKCNMLLCLIKHLAQHAEQALNARTDHHMLRCGIYTAAGG